MRWRLARSGRVKKDFISGTRFFSALGEFLGIAKPVSPSKQPCVDSGERRSVPSIRSAAANEDGIFTVEEYIVHPASLTGQPEQTQVNSSECQYVPEPEMFMTRQQQIIAKQDQFLPDPKHLKT